MKRQLSAIMAGDIVGYSRLMEADEIGTIRRQKNYLSHTVKPIITRYEGRIVKLMGDGLLVEFPSVVDAVKCAVDLQRIMARHESEVPEAQRITYRIGINLGDVFYEDGDVFGDGVNIAARLEEMADPGGICISGTAFDHLKSNIPVEYQSLGDVQVKNIESPVRAYRVIIEGQAPAASAAPVRSRRRYVVGLAVATVLLAAVAWFALQSDRFLRVADEPAVQPGPSEAVAAIAPAPPDRPGIAVLPFNNLGGDAEQDYFSDGMTEDLITDLSGVSGLFVLARNTTFTYKGRAVNVQQVGAELGVAYVLEGSVRRIGNRVRINAQLIDAKTGGHLWAERYDRELTDVFALQDDVVQRIVAALAITLNTDEEERLSRNKKIDPEAYDYLLRGLEKLRRFSAATNLEARAFFEQAVAIEPTFARAIADLALTYALEDEQHWTDEPVSASRKALELGEKARDLAPDLAQVHFVLSIVYRANGQHAQSIAAAERSIELDPNYADGFATLAFSLNFGGYPEQALTAIQRATKLNPLKPFFYVWVEGQSHYLLGNFEIAANRFEQVAASNPQFPAAHKMLAATYVELNRLDDAEWAAAELQSIATSFSLTDEELSSPYLPEAVNDRYIENLRSAGLE